jgi:hypothetical protein
LLVPALAASMGLLFEPIPVLASNGSEPPPHATLVLEVGVLGERCVSKSELEQAVQAQLGRIAFVEAGALTALVVRVRLAESSPGHFRAVVTSEGVPATEPSAASKRELEAAGDCRALDEPLALVVALLVDAEPEPPPLPPAPAPAPEPPPEPSPPAEDTGPVSSAPSWESAPAGPWHLALGASGEVGFGLLPHIAGGGSLALVVTPPAWPGLRLRAAGFAPDRARAAPGAWLGVTLLFGGAGVCPELGVVGRLGFEACLGVEATLLRVVSHGLDAPRRTLRFGGQATVALLAWFSLGAGFRAVLEGGTTVPFGTARFTVDRDGQRVELYRTPFAPALLSLGLSYAFY